MKILVMSDSHRMEAKVYDIIHKNLDCDVIIHLGDGEDDFSMAEELLPELKNKRIIQVGGNCDLYSSMAITSFDKIGGFLFYSTHGHMQGVKSGLARLWLDAKNNGREVALYGHTHEQFYECREGIHIFNPGAVRNGEYGIITIDESNHQIQFEHR